MRILKYSKTSRGYDWRIDDDNTVRTGWCRTKVGLESIRESMRAVVMEETSEPEYRWWCFLTILLLWAGSDESIRDVAREAKNTPWVVLLVPELAAYLVLTTVAWTLLNGQ